MTLSFNEHKETYTDTMQVTGHDILNLVHASDMMPTLRKTIDRNCPITFPQQLYLLIFFLKKFLFQEYLFFYNLKPVIHFLDL